MTGEIDNFKFGVPRPVNCTDKSESLFGGRTEMNSQDPILPVVILFSALAPIMYKKG